MKKYPCAGQRLSIRERLLFRSMRADNGCWIWQGALDSRGYGNFLVGKKFLRAHRVSYEHFIGSIPADQVIDHICCQPRCINPNHLQPVSFSENVRLARKRDRVLQGTCKNGHPWTPENTFRRRNGWRNCRACNALRTALAREAAKN